MSGRTEITPIHETLILCLIKSSATAYDVECLTACGSLQLLEESPLVQDCFLVGAGAFETVVDWMASELRVNLPMTNRVSEAWHGCKHQRRARCTTLGRIRRLRQAIDKKRPECRFETGDQTLANVANLIARSYGASDKESVSEIRAVLSAINEMSGTRERGEARVLIL